MRSLKALAVEILKIVRQFMMENVIDPKYEYDAPVYVDFTTLAVDQVPDDGADKWFGKKSPVLSLSPESCISSPFYPPSPAQITV